jgi:hypothetical protein
MDKSLSEVDKLKARVFNLKPFPAGHEDLYLEAFPEYNNKRGLDKYRNIVSMKSTDEEMITKMEMLFSVKKRKLKKVRA